MLVDLQDVEGCDHDVQGTAESAVVSCVGFNLPVLSDWCAEADVGE